MLDWQQFVKDVRWEVHHYSTGHPGMEGDTCQWYVRYLLRFEGPVVALTLFQTLNTLRARRRQELLLLVFPAVYFAFICRFVVRNDRTLLPIVPFMLILAAVLVEHSIDHTANIADPTKRRLLSALLLAAMGILLIWPLTNTIRSDIRLSNPDGREMARVWINSHLPAGAKIGAEAYSPYLDPAQFEITYLRHIIDHRPDWYLDSGFEYLVFSQGMYGRFYLEPNRYRAEVSQYDLFFSRFTEIARFNANDYEVRVLQVHR